MALSILSPTKNASLERIVLSAFEVKALDSEFNIVSAGGVSGYPVSWGTASNGVIDIEQSVTLTILADKTVTHLDFSNQGDGFRVTLPVAEYFEFGGQIQVTQMQLTLGEA